MIYQSKVISARTIIRHDLSVKNHINPYIHLLFVNNFFLNNWIFWCFFLNICSKFYVIFSSPVYPPATTSTYTTEDNILSTSTSSHTTENNILSTSDVYTTATTENNILSTSDVYTTATTEGKYKISAALKVETQRVRYDEL